MFSLGATALALSGLFQHPHTVDVEAIEVEIDTPYLPEITWLAIDDQVEVLPYCNSRKSEYGVIIDIDAAQELVRVAYNEYCALWMDVARVRLIGGENHV